MFNNGGSPTITGCTFTGNTAAISGGGLDNGYCNPTVTNCTFTGNRAHYAGGMYNEGSRPTVTNCTFSANAASLGGGGMYNYYNSNPTIINCIVWGNSGGQGGGNGIFTGYLSSATLSHTDSQDFASASADPASGNFGADPLFVRNPSLVLYPNGTVNVVASDFGDLHLQAGSPASPCIDAGDNSAVANIPADLDGNRRIAFGGVSLTVDLGAYEYGSIPYVLDTTPPVITTPSDMTVIATSTAGAVVNFTVTATDGVDGTVPVTCTPPSGSTFAPGKTTVNCSASDAAGNPASKSFTVWVQYLWSGYLSPLSKQTFNRGSTIPVKFALTGASAPITNLSATLYITAPGATTETLLGTFKYDPTLKQYQYNWNTSKTMSAGTYTLRADLGDAVPSRTVSILLK
jgi:hypothetical protein